MTKAKKWVRGILAVAIVGGAGAAVVKTEISDAYAQSPTNRLFAVWRLDNETTSNCQSAANMRKVVATRGSEEATATVVPTTRNGVAVSSSLYNCGTGNSIAGKVFYHHGQVQVASGDVLNATGMFADGLPSGGDSISSDDVTAMGNCKLKLCAGSNCDGRSDLNGYWAVDNTNGTRTVCTYQGDWF